MKRLSTGLLAILLLLQVMITAAATTDLKPTLLLDHIKMIKTGESDGDELYFDITVYRAKQPAQYFRLPKQPFHEPSKLVGQFSKVKLWSEPLKVGESVTIIVSLIETDYTPLNPDDLIGLVRVKLKNNAGKLQATWDMPNQSMPAIDHNDKVQKFDVKGEGSQYEIYLSLVK